MPVCTDGYGWVQRVLSCLYIDKPRWHCLRLQQLPRTHPYKTSAPSGTPQCASHSVPNKKNSVRHYISHRQVAHTHYTKKKERRKAFISRASGATHHYFGRRQATHTPVDPPHRPTRRAYQKKRTPTGVLIGRASGATHHYFGRRQATHTPVDPPHQPTRRNRRDDRVMMTKKVGGDVNSCSRVSPDFQSQRTRGRAAPTRAPEKLFLNKFLPAGNQ